MFMLFSLTGVFQGIIDSFANVIDVIFGLLPLSPFVYLVQYSLSSDVLLFLNYLLPISQILAITELWLTCVSGYYLYQVILKWVKLCS